MSIKNHKKNKLDVDKSFKLLVESAFDFLKKALELFDTDPKRSVIEYYLGLELFFKARLMKEHWTLVAEKPGEVNIEDFLNGNAKTVYLETAKKRLENVAGEIIPKDAYDCFASIGKHRNKMVHFYHEAIFDEKARQALAAEQIRGWYFLNSLLTIQWREYFSELTSKISELNVKIHERKDFLKVKFESLKYEIYQKKNMGSSFEKCPTCEFLSFEIKPNEETLIIYGMCLVCGQSKNIACIDCEHCHEKIYLFPEEAKCPKCKNEIDTAAELTEHKHDPDDVYQIADCPECGEIRSVGRRIDGNGYVCTKCFECFDALYACGFCGEYSTNVNEFSYLVGCEYCDGLNGHTKDD